MLKVSPHKCLPSILLLARRFNEQQEDSGSYPVIAKVEEAQIQSVTLLLQKFYGNL